MPDDGQLWKEQWKRSYRTENDKWTGLLDWFRTPQHWMYRPPGEVNQPVVAFQIKMHSKSVLRYGVHLIYGYHILEAMIHSCKYEILDKMERTKWTTSDGEKETDRELDQKDTFCELQRTIIICYGKFNLTSSSTSWPMLLIKALQSNIIWNSFSEMCGWWLEMLGYWYCCQFYYAALFPFAFYCCCCNCCHFNENLLTMRIFK